jgi:hypothetical protein
MGGLPAVVAAVGVTSAARSVSRPQQPDEHRLQRPILFRSRGVRRDRVLPTPKGPARFTQIGTAPPMAFPGGREEASYRAHPCRRFVSPRMVRHLRVGGQTRDAVSGNAPRRRERLSRVFEWLTILGQQMTVALIIKLGPVELPPRVLVRQPVRRTAGLRRPV